MVNMPKAKKMKIGRANSKIDETRKKPACETP